METDARALGLQLQPVAVCHPDQFDGPWAPSTSVHGYVAAHATVVDTLS
jgi:hypothetical protein